MKLTGISPNKRALLFGLAAAAWTLLAPPMHANAGECLTVGVPTKSAPYAAIFMGSKLGTFAKAGCDVGDPVVMGGGAKTAAALVGGSIDVALGGATEIANLKNANQDIRILGSVFPTFTIDIVASNDLEMPKDATLKEKILALKGKTIGITSPGSGTEAIIAYLFSAAGLDYKTDATLVSVGGDLSAALGAMKAGRIDVVCHAFGIGNLAESQGIGKTIISPARGDIPQLHRVLHQVVYTLGPTLESKRENLSTFIKGLALTYSEMRANPAEVTKFVHEELGLDDKAAGPLAATILDVTPETPAIDVSTAQKGFEDNLAVGAAVGKSIKAPDLSELVASDFIAQALGN